MSLLRITLAVLLFTASADLQDGYVTYLPSLGGTTGLVTAPIASSIIGPNNYVALPVSAKSWPTNAVVTLKSNSTRVFNACTFDAQTVETIAGSGDATTAWTKQSVYTPFCSKTLGVESPDDKACVFYYVSGVPSMAVGTPGADTKWYILLRGFVGAGPAGVVVTVTAGEDPVVTAGKQVAIGLIVGLSLGALLLLCCFTLCAVYIVRSCRGGGGGGARKTVEVTNPAHNA